MSTSTKDISIPLSSVKVRRHADRFNREFSSSGGVSNKSSKCDAGKYHVWTTSDAQRLIGNREVFIWGAGQKGRGFLLALRRNGFSISNFIDSSSAMQKKSFAGVGGISPQEFFDMYGPKRKAAFVFVASVDAKNKQIFKELEASGFTKGVDFEDIQTLSPFYPTIEVTGICNLRCSSCIRSDKEIIDDGKYMSFENYEKVIKKMISEIPFLYLVDLYVWGEPILNKDLPKMIRLNNELGLASGLSTNLNNIKNLEAVLDAGPAQIRVSLSGASPETYEITHTGGKWKKVENNLQILSQLISERGKKTLVEVYFHIYKHNVHEIGKIKEVCRKLEFNFHPSLGILFHDFALQYTQDGAVSESARPAMERLIIPMPDLVHDVIENGSKNCILTRVVPVVNWDLTVMPCCTYSYSSIEKNYLDLPLSELIPMRTQSSVCATCQSHSLHRWNNQGFYSELVNKIVTENS